MGDRCSCEINCEVSLEKCSARVWPGFIWRRIGPSGLHVGGGERLLGYQERLCCLELACQPALRGVLNFVALALRCVTNLLDFMANLSFQFSDLRLSNDASTDDCNKPSNFCRYNPYRLCFSDQLRILQSVTHFI